MITPGLTPKSMENSSQCPFKTSTMSDPQARSIPLQRRWLNGSCSNSITASSWIAKGAFSASVIPGKMWTPQTILPTPEASGPLAGLRSNFAAYGLGWMLRDYHGYKMVGHGGGVPGFVSLVMLVP